MQTETLPIKRKQLLEKANKIIRKHDDFIQGMYADDVEQKDEVLVFKGEYFLDSYNLPTTKSTAVFNMFKHLAHILSEKYHLAD
ncbi:YciN family protein [Xenorhabdus bovienii]|uniref:YciN family protein n=1 Tax=Xenorhabdus bovienii TaxID=40576 RepID=UPI00237CF863|nr:YciN family protein [Xenorhabdus bovienii]MDE1474076.1 YciN family protein [Xenorhabdus bovienii]